MKKKRGIKEVSGKNEEEEETKKRKILEEITELVQHANTKMLEETLENLKRKKIKKKGFSTLKYDKDVFEFFGTFREGFGEFEFEEGVIDDEQINKAAEEILKRRKEELGRWGGDEGGARDFISDLIRITRRTLNFQKVRIRTGLNIEGKLHHGPLDYALLRSGCCLVVVEAKKDNINQGVNQLLFQLNAVSEQYEGKEESREIYYGFAATDKVWVPVKFEPQKKKWKEKISIGSEYNVVVKENLKQVIYLLKSFLKEK